MAIWHVPQLYDVTLRSAAVHDLEHGTFLVFGMLFWIPVLESPPMHARLDELRSALYVTAGAATGWLLALVLAFAPRPLYPAYEASRLSTPGTERQGFRDCCGDVRGYR